ncbi:NAD(P)-dependent oxidoreductase [Paenibacillus ehimensis]|uniref:NAD(P)-dependent oxidoreductase n=1 Tax=Paenibacillus ehimensis TaxID=79264 RepID=UPI000FDAE368|nr:NAD(P)-binding domain-containing protein [Paenibacillus ehimensis]MEC0213854.1 NAD(P)-binding domain-containing protein [Paenibacillus ehimensis]
MNSSNLKEDSSVGNASAATNRKSVTVMGLGPMGQAMAGVFLECGYAVTVWNRTASKADELVAKGATRASTVNEALAANELVILSLTDYDVMYAILEPASMNLSGKVLVNLSSDTPEKVRKAAKWLAGRGARHVTGGVQVPPSGIGKSESSTYYSGPREVFEAHRETLEVLTGTDYRGEDPGLAMLYYQIQMDIFWTSMLSYLHALAVATANGITAEQFLPYASATLSSLPKFVEFYTPRLDEGKHPGDVDRLAMGLASVEHVVHTTKDAGIDIAFPAAVLEIFKRGMENGHSGDSFTSLIEIFKNSIRP